MVDTCRYGGGSHGGTTGFPEAGGGGSFNAGTNQFNIAGANVDDGTVIIRPLSSGAPNDVGIVGIDSPAVFCPGTEDVWATINNYGTTQVTTVTVDWSVDGVLQPTVTFTGNLDTIGGTGATTGQILLGSFSFSTNNPYNVSVWTSNPNQRFQNPEHRKLQSHKVHLPGCPFLNSTIYSNLS